MARLNVALLLDSPLLVGRPRQGDVYQSQGFLPGSVLRGAVAEALMAGWSAEQRACLLYTSPSPRDRTRSRMPSSA